MITFKQFLGEAAGYADLPALMRSSCGEFLSESRGAGVLVRGVKTLGSRSGTVEVAGMTIPFYKKSVRTDRKPLSTSQAVHEAIDDWFDKKHGLRPRSQGMFCYGPKHEVLVAQYGKPCVVVPIGPFEYVWSPKVRDLWFNVLGEDEKLYAADGSVDPAAVDAMMRKLKYTKTGLDRAVDDWGEVVVVCKEYYAFQIPKEVRERRPTPSQSIQAMKDFFDAFTKAMQ